MGTFVERLLMLIKNHADGKPTVFAKKCGIPGGTFHAYINGRLPHSDQLIRIYKYCGVNINWLLTGEGDVYAVSQEKDSEDCKNDDLASQYFSLIGQFKDKPRAIRINTNLIDIENLSKSVFEKIDQYISDTTDTVRLSTKDRSLTTPQK